MFLNVEALRYSELLSYVLASAHDIAAQKQHKSVSASDVLKALELLDLGDMIPHLTNELQGMCIAGLYLSLLNISQRTATIKRAETKPNAVA